MSGHSPSKTPGIGQRILYPYAESANGLLVHIDTVDPSANPRPQFVCLSCRRRMSARICTTKQNHFAHVAAGACAPEGYFHRLAKMTFAEAFQSAVVERRPFFLTLEVPRECTRFEREHGFTCKSIDIRRTDLTKYFDLVRVEAEHDGFRADVLLSSTRRNEVMLVEMLVTHACEAEKINRGHRILEISIQSEADALALGTGEIARPMHYKAHNFQVRDTQGDFCGGECQKKLAVFWIRKGGKSIIQEMTPRRYLSRNTKDVVYESVIPPNAVRVLPALFHAEVRKAHVAGVPLKNCFVCRYHGMSDGSAAVFCRYLKKATGSNTAAECPSYRPVTPAELVSIDARNKAYSQRASSRNFPTGGLQW